MTDIIRFEDFSFKYHAQSQPTLKHINLSIKKGEKVLIVGASGSGKSTLGQCLNGIIPNTYSGEISGRLLIQGQDAFNLSIYDKSQLVSTVLQDTDGQFIGLTVAEDMAFALENDLVDQAEMTKQVNHWAKILDLTDLLSKRPQDLSGGQKQRVSLAGVLIDDSPILLFDEPLANLDPKSGEDTIALIDQLHHQTGATTIIIEHRLEDVLHRPVDRIVLLDEGEIVFDGRPTDLLASQLLSQHGIREPLYITLLKELGYDLSVADNLADLSSLDLSELSFSHPSKATSPKQTDTLLNLSNWTVAYETDRPVLNKLNLTIGRGERLAIVGKNGAGKSTLAKSLCQFLPASGQIDYAGQDISGDSIKERADRIGYVLQNPNQMISQTMIFDEVALGLRLRGFDESDIEERVFQTLKICGLYPFRKWPISALSYGQKKRVTIASILVLNPDIILLDEPTAGQDQKNYTELMTFLNQLNQLGHTIVMITHDMHLMMEYSDRCLVVADGQIIADASPLEVLSRKDLLQKANLRPTSIFSLADRIQVPVQDLTDYYIQKGGQHGQV